jgi:hypothetical protein
MFGERGFADERLPFRRVGEALCGVNGGSGRSRGAAAVEEQIDEA